jgi:hypothetical protein
MIAYYCIYIYIVVHLYYCSIVACGGATRHPTLKLDSLPSSPILGVPDTKTGRDLQELVSSRVAAKTGATIALQHDSRPLSLRKSLKEQLCHDGVELNSLSLSHGRWVNRLFSCIFSNHWSESYHALTALVTWPLAMGDACEVVRVPALRYCKRLEFDQGFAGDQRRVCAWRYHSAVWGIADRQIARNASFELAEIVIWWFLQPKLLGEITRCSIQQKRVLRVTHPHTHPHTHTHTHWWKHAAWNMLQEQNSKNGYGFSGVTCRDCVNLPESQFLMICYEHGNITTEMGSGPRHGFVSGWLVGRVNVRTLPARIWKTLSSGPIMSLW